MCGIVGYYARESIPDERVFDILFKEAEKRGSDAFGIVIIDTNGRTKYTRRSINKYDDNKLSILFDIKEEMVIGDLLLANFRLEPETESRSVLTDLVSTTQPIQRDGCTIVHNGAVNKSDYDRIMSWVSDPVSCIDSEAIIVSYIKNNKDIQKTMEEFGGGTSALLYDKSSHQVVVMQSHNPMSHGYFRGYGMFWHSSQQALDDVRLELTKTTGDGCCMWENYYAHPKSTPFRCTRIDLDSGFMSKSIYFKPNYKSHPTWEQEDKGREKYLVGASSGIDSTTNLAILKATGCDVEAIHLKYGHRGEDSEEIALKEICKELDIPVRVIDQTAYYKEIDNFSMLTDSEKPIKTGGNKSIAAWVVGRNFNIMRILCDIAESEILQNKTDRVNICLGFNISEESVYPDNSEMFVNSFMDAVKLGYLSGDRMSFCNITQNLNKSDMMHLLNEMGLYTTLIPKTISCDRPIVEDGTPKNCSVIRDGIQVPGCGSGWLYTESAINSELDDIKEYYTVDDPDYVYNKKKRSKVKRKHKTNDEVINALKIGEFNKKVLRQII